MIVPFSAGGGADETARELAKHLSSVLHQPVVVDNRPGAGNFVAESFVARSPADGYTLLYDTSPFAVNAALRRLAINLRQALEPITLVVSAPMILVASPDIPAKDLAQFIKFVQSHPGEISFASAGIGSAAHFAGESLNAMAGLDMLHIPYKGGPGAIADVMGNRVAIYFASPVASQAHVKSGRLNALGVSSPSRLTEFPDVMTIAEAGLANFDIQTWHGVFVPAGTPSEIKNKLNLAIKQALKDPEWKAKLDQQGYVIKDSSSQEFSTFIDDEMARWTKMAKERNIVLD